MRAWIVMAMLCWTGAARAETLYEALGSQPGLVRIVDGATESWLHDPRIAATFDTVNIDRFKRLLVEQLCQLSDGGCTYHGRAMGPAHRGLHLDTLQFNALVEGLQGSMRAEGIPFRVQGRLLSLLAPMHRDVVTR